MGKVGEARLDFVANTSGARGDVESLTATIVRQQQQINALNAKFHEAGNTIRNETKESRGAVRLLSEELGIHLNRELTNVVAQSKLIGPAIGAAFSAIAVVGFIQLAVEAAEKIAKLSTELGGFGEEAQKQYKAQLELNKLFVKSAEDRKKIENEIALIGLDGSKRDAKVKEQQLADLKEINQELERQHKIESDLRAQAAQTRTITILSGPRGFGPSRTETVSTDAAKEAKGKLVDVGLALSDLTRKQQDLNEKIKQTGAEFTNDVGSEGAEAFKKAQAELDKFYKQLGQGQDAIAKESLSPGEQKIREIQNTINDLRVAALQFGPQEQQKAADVINQLFYAMETQAQKNSTEFTAALRKPLDEAINNLFKNATVIVPKGPLDQLKEVERQITAIFEAERANEEAARASAEAAGVPQIELEQKLVSIRHSDNDELRNLIAQFDTLATQVKSTNPEMIQKAEEFHSKLEKLNAGFKTISTSVKQAITNDVGSFFQGIISGSETASQAFKRFAQSLISDLSAIIIKMYITSLLTKALGGLLGGGGNPNLSGAAAEPGFFSSGGGRASGGPVSAGVPYLVGESGPEPFIPSTSGTILPHSALIGGGANVQVNVINQSSQQVDAHQQSSHYDVAIDQHIVNVVLKDIQRNGPLRTAMSG